MVAARDARQVAGFRYEEIIEIIDWNRVILQAYGEHQKVHPELEDNDLCGSCIKSILLRTEEPGDLVMDLAMVWHSVNPAIGKVIKPEIRDVVEDYKTVPAEGSLAWRLDRVEDILRKHKLLVNEDE